MLKEGKFGVQEAVCVVTLTISSKLFYTTPGLLTRYVGNAGWQMTLVSCLVAIIFFYFVYLLLKRFPGKNIVEIFEISLGRFLGFLFSLAFAVAFLLYASVLLREFADTSKVFVFPLTGPSILIAVFIVVVVVVAMLGLETIVRASKIIAYIAIFTYALLPLLASRNFKLYHMFPLLGYGLDKTITTGFMRSSAYAEVLILAVFAGSLQGIGHIKKAGFLSLILSGILLSTGLLAFILVFPYTMTQELTVPIYIMARIIKYGAFIQRLDPVFIILWNISSMATVTILFYCAVSIYCKVFRLQDTKPVIIPMAVLLFTIAMAPKDFLTVITENLQQTRLYGMIVFFGLPLITLIIAIIRKRKGDVMRA